jgi:putative endonuclease
LGQRGEQVAARHLLRVGCRILAQNWRCTLGELDIVAQDGEMIVFVEVRTRRAGTQAALESITPAKRRRLMSAMRLFLAQHSLDDAPCRVDVIAVAFDDTGEHGSLSHARDVFTW